MTEFYQNRIACKNSDEPGKVNSVFVRIAEALGELEQDRAKLPFLRKRGDGILELHGGIVPPLTDFMGEQTAGLYAELNPAFSPFIK